VHGGRQLPDASVQHGGREVRVAVRDQQRLQPRQQLHGGGLRAGRPVTEAEYEAAAFPELKALIRALDALDETDIQAELAGDILTVEFEDGARYVINSHRAARQLWMAAERNAWHFDLAAPGGSWVAKKSGDELWSTLTAVLEKKLGKKVELTRRVEPD
jgi:CyaY protein